MIRGLHGLFYSSEPEAAREFLRNQLKLPHTDVGGGWLIFDLPEADLGIHPTGEGQAGGGHDVSFYCDDIQGTVADLKSRGVSFEGEIADHGYGFVTYFTIPGGIRVQLYEPKYQKKVRAPAPRKTAARTGTRAAAKKKPAAKTAAKRTPAKKAATKSKTAAKRAPAKKASSGRSKRSR